MSLDTRPPTGTDLFDKSVDLLLAGQESTGAWLASPNFAQYRFCWIRDGVFIAHALDRVGHHDHAAAFHHWTAATILRHAGKVERIAADHADLSPDQPLDPILPLHPRFSNDGQEVDGDWGNFQLDGYGLWLTGLHHHLETTGSPVGPYRDAVETVVRYLALTWDLPGYDSWEEYPHRRHPTTLVAVAQGLAAAQQLLDVPHDDLPDRIVDLIRRQGTDKGSLTKFLADGGSPGSGSDTTADPRDGAIAGHERPGKDLPPGTVDASALLVLGDFGLFRDDTALTRTTLQRITTDLVVDGGVHRYRQDEYYGGGLWIVLAGALAQIQLAHGDLRGSRGTTAWIEAQADHDGHLAEQVPTSLQHPELHEPWTRRWGPIATPLLWSHAMYVIARTGNALA